MIGASEIKALAADQQQLAAVKARVAARLQQHRENLDGWSEGRSCPTCKGTGCWPGNRTCVVCKGLQVVDPGYLVPTEPDMQERESVRRELEACIAELGLLAKLLGLE